MTRTLHLQRRVAPVRSTYGSNPPDVAARLERGAHMQLPGTRRVSDQTRQSGQPVASDVAERRDDDVRQPIRNSKRSRHASAPNDQYVSSLGSSQGPRLPVSNPGSPECRTG